MHPHRTQYSDDVYYFHLRGLRERFWNFRHQIIVVTTSSGQIIGAADWRRLGQGGQEKELWSIDPRNLVQPLIHAFHAILLQIWPNRAADPAKASFLDGAVASSESHWSGKRAECWDLHICGVDPDSQGEGVGRMLVQWGVTKAKEEGEGVVASVLCGEKNRNFYGKCGFGTEVVESGRKECIVLFTK